MEVDGMGHLSHHFQLMRQMFNNFPKLISNIQKILWVQISLKTQGTKCHGLILNMMKLEPSELKVLESTVFNSYQGWKEK